MTGNEVAAYRRRVAHAAAEGTQSWYPMQFSLWSALLVVLWAGKSTVWVSGIVVITVSFAMAQGLAAARGWLMLDSVRQAGELRNNKPLVHGLLGVLAVSLMYGALETDYAYLAGSSPASMWLSKAVAVYLGSLVLAVGLLALQLTFRFRVAWRYPETRGTYCVESIRLAHTGQRAELHAELVGKDRSCTLRTNLSTTNPELQADIVMALSLTVGSTVTAVEACGQVVLLGVRSHPKAGVEVAQQ